MKCKASQIELTVFVTSTVIMAILFISGVMMYDECSDQSCDLALLETQNTTQLVDYIITSTTDNTISRSYRCKVPVNSCRYDLQQIVDMKTCSSRDGPVYVGSCDYNESHARTPRIYLFTPLLLIAVFSCVALFCVPPKYADNKVYECYPWKRMKTIFGYPVRALRSIWDFNQIDEENEH